MMPFEWERGAFDGVETKWNGPLLIAGDNGAWGVFQHGRRIVGHEDQTKAKDIHDARKRAQANAMIVHQLRTQQQ